MRAVPNARVALLCAALGVTLREHEAAAAVTHGAPKVFHNTTDVMTEEEKGATSRTELNTKFDYEEPIVWESTESLKPKTNEEIRFELISDKTKTMEVILFVAHHWEEHVRITIRSAEDAEGESDPHILGNAGCSHFIDDCVHQRYFQYTLPPLVSKHDMYSNRLAFRVQPSANWFAAPLKGKWAIKISNALPEGVDNAFVKLVVKQSDKTFRELLFQGFIIIFLSVCVCLLLGDFLNERITNMRIIRPEDEDDRNSFQVDWTRFEATVVRVHTVVRGTIADRYRRLREDTTAGAAQGGDSENPEPVEEEEDDEEFCCRICRSTHPREDLFSPCACSGSMKYIHRSCLEEWREKTTSEVNKKHCSECKTPFVLAIHHDHARYEFALNAIAKMAKMIATLVLLESVLVLVGYAFKVAAGAITNDLAKIRWTVDVYHHLVALTVILALFFHYMFLADILKRAVPHPCLQALVLLLSLLLEVGAGHVGQYLMWAMGSALWDWQVHFCTGFLVVYLYAVLLHGLVINAFNKWKLKRRIERVVENPDAEAQDDSPDGGAEGRAYESNDADEPSGAPAVPAEVNASSDGESPGNTQRANPLAAPHAAGETALQTAAPPSAEQQVGRASPPPEELPAVGGSDEAGGQAADDERAPLAPPPPLD